MRSKFLLVVVALLFSITGFALTPQVTESGFNFAEAFADVGAYSTTLVLIVDVLKNVAPKIFKDNFLRIFSWLLPIALGFIAWKNQWGFFAEYVLWWKVLLVGIVTSVSMYFTAYLGILNMILQAANIDLKGYRFNARNR